MRELCRKCRQIIEQGEAMVSTKKNLRKIHYHARCFGAPHLEEVHLDQRVRMLRGLAPR